MGLMGENGAGKSTMMKCLFGTYHVMPSLRNSSAAFLFMPPSSTIPTELVGYRPRNRLSVTLRSRHWFSSW